MEVITEIKYFSPDGKDEMPNGVYLKKGGFFHECELNAEKFKIPDVGYVFNNGAASFTEGAAIFISGTISILPNNANIEEELIFSWLTNEFIQIHTDHAIHFSIGNFFYGRFGEIFNETSLCFSINGIKWKLLVQLNENFLVDFKIGKALIKDLNSGKVFVIEIA